MWRRYAVTGRLGMARLATCGADRIEIAGGADQTYGHGLTPTPATESVQGNALLTTADTM